MGIPDVSMTIQDGALGLAPPSSAHTQLKIGLAPKGKINVIQSAADMTTLVGIFGRGGPLAEACAMALQAGQGIYAINANPSSYGAVGSVTKTASNSAGTLTVVAKPSFAIVARCAAGGTIGNATIQFSTDGGGSYGAPVVSASTVVVPEAPFVTVAMGAGTYVAGDTWAIATDGTPTFTGTGQNGVTVSTASPVDAYSLVVDVIDAGARGAGTFLYSLDGGNTFSPKILIPSSGAYVIPDTGLLLTFSAATFGTADAWACTITAAGFSTTDLTNAFNVALADSRTWGFVHVVGAPSTVANAATLATTLQSLLTTAAGAFRYARGIIEVPSDSDGNTISGFAATATDRVAWCAGYATMTSPLSGRQVSRNAAWTVAARAAAAPVSEDLGRVASGSLPGVGQLARDEQATPGLDSQRFTTLRTIIGRQGKYLTTGRLGAAFGSDFQLWQNGRVIDVACDATRDRLLTYLNASVRVNPNGTIFEKDAKQIEAYVEAGLRAALTQPGDASDVSAVVSRSANILSTQVLPVSVRVLPLGYAKWISVDIGFANPALSVTK